MIEVIDEPEKPFKYKAKYAQKYWYELVDVILLIVSKPFLKFNIKKAITEIENQPKFLWAKFHCDLNSWTYPNELKKSQPFWWMNMRDSDPKIKGFWINSRMYGKSKSPLIRPLRDYMEKQIGTKATFEYWHITRCRMTKTEHEEWWIENKHRHEKYTI